MRNHLYYNVLPALTVFNARAVYGWTILVLAYLLVSTVELRALDIVSSSQQGLIATSIAHTCALTKATDAGVRCWGANVMGQLGDGTTEQRTSPVDVVGLSSGVKAVGVGDAFSCALLTNGQVQCWGLNSVGQLGNNSVSSSSSPITVLDATTSTALTGATLLSVGAYHACAVLSSGGAKCWGGNVMGQLGDGSLTNRSMAVDVLGFTSNVKTIDAGSNHTCLASLSPNRIYCFGRNDNYQLGDGTNTWSSVPVMVPGYSNAIEVSAGNQHSCARLDSGALICWGGNSEGAIGDGTTSTAQSPVTVINGGSPFERVSAGLAHTCATNQMDGKVTCWGRGEEGQNGDGGFNQRNSPTALNPILTAAIDISSGGYHACAWMSRCSAMCWGSNSNGQLGDGTLNSSSIPIAIIFCQSPAPTPTPIPTSSSTADACASESSCIPNPRLTNPLNPVAPPFKVAASTADKGVTIIINSVTLGIPVDSVTRENLRYRLSRFLRRKVTNLAGAIRVLNVHFIVSILKAPSLSSSSVRALGLPTKYRTETRKRRVTTRLSPGTYLARITVRLKDAKGRTFVTGSTTRQTRFSVR